MGSQLRHRVKRIAQETADLANPGTLPLNAGSCVWLRVLSDRMDQVKAMICGPEDTPYENGLFVFDINLPNEYVYIVIFSTLISFCLYVRVRMCI
jgi:ubiquitin-protein ligase